MVRYIFVFSILFTGSTLWANLQWQVTHGTIERGRVQLDNHKVRLKAFPHYVDVEEEAVITTTGGLWRGGDRNSLEIYGTFNLDSNAVIVGMLLWNGDIILKAKLKPRALADKDYEDVVDRDTLSIPPRPRDPAIIERTGSGTYNIKIYPVVLGQSRKLRVRYHLPLKSFQDKPELSIEPIFSNSISYINTATQINIESEVPNAQFNLKFGNNQFQIYAPSNQSIQGIRSFSLGYIQNTLPLFRTTQFSNGPYSGHYLGLFSAIPDSLLNQIKTFDIPLNDDFIDVKATLTSGGREITLSPSCSDRFVCAPLVFNGKSNRPWSPYIRWEITAFNRLLLEHLQEVDETRTVQDTGMAVLWAGSGTAYSFLEENNRGATYRFIDDRMSLLALEEDSLGIEQQKEWELAGVPRLQMGEIIPEDTLVPFTTLYPEDGVIEIEGGVPSPVINIAPLDQLQVKLLGAGSGLLEITFPDHFQPHKALTLVLYNLKGVLISEWNAPIPSNRRIQLSSSKFEVGHYLLRISYEGKNMFKQIHIQ